MKLELKPRSEQLSSSHFSQNTTLLHVLGCNFPSQHQVLLKYNGLDDGPQNDTSTGMCGFELSWRIGSLQMQEVKDLEMTSSWILLSPKSNQCPYKRKSEGDLRSTEETKSHPGGDMKMETETERM